MIKLNDIVSKSIFTSIGTLLNDQSLLLFKAYISFNKHVIQKFPCVIYAFNGDRHLVDSAKKIITEINYNSIVIITENLGHTFGTFLLDNAIFEEASKHSEYDYIWKFSNDVIIESSILDYNVEQSDFYYINNIGYISLDYYNEPERPKYSKENLVRAVMDQSYFYPQTNYYIIKNGFKFYPNKDIIYDLKQQYDSIKIHKPDIHPWHAIYECDSENMLKKTVIQNNLSAYHLLDEQDTAKVIEYVDVTKNYDGSHKNVLYSQLGNLCHFHYPQYPVYVI